MSDILLNAIDTAVAGLCACGAEPAAGSAYCSDDCRPTHIGEHTDQRGPGEDYATPMRWRPDLVTADVDEHLHLVDERLLPSWRYRGRFTSTIFWRTDREAVWHLQLDDGYRRVGMDVEAFPGPEDAADAWARLERQLGDPRLAGGSTTRFWDAVLARTDQALADASMTPSTDLAARGDTVFTESEAVESPAGGPSRCGGCGRWTYVVGACYRCQTLATVAEFHAATSAAVQPRPIDQWPEQVRALTRPATFPTRIDAGPGVLRTLNGYLVGARRHPTGADPSGGSIGSVFGIPIVEDPTLADGQWQIRDADGCVIHGSIATPPAGIEATDVPHGEAARGTAQVVVDSDRPDGRIDALRHAVRAEQDRILAEAVARHGTNLGHLRRGDTVIVRPEAEASIAALREVGVNVVVSPYLPDGTSALVFDTEAMQRSLTRTFGQVREAVQPFANVLAEFGRAVARLLDQQLRTAGVVDDTPPADPRERALYLRRNRNTGSAPQQRAPRRIDPRSSR